MTLHWPQLVYLVMVVMGLGVVLSKHGEAGDRHNFWKSLGATVLVLWVLYSGGFFGGAA